MPKNPVEDRAIRSIDRARRKPQARPDAPVVATPSAPKTVPKREVEVGAVYAVKVNGRLVPVRIQGKAGTRGLFPGLNLRTMRVVHVTARKLRRKLGAADLRVASDRVAARNPGDSNPTLRRVSAQYRMEAARLDR